jgi:hypothetical protein
MLLERASANGPLVVIMEDIDWADESTRHLRRFLARALTDGPRDDHHQRGWTHSTRAANRVRCRLRGVSRVLPQLVAAACQAGGLGGVACWFDGFVVGRACFLTAAGSRYAARTAATRRTAPTSPVSWPTLDPKTQLTPLPRLASLAEAQAKLAAIRASEV